MGAGAGGEKGRERSLSKLIRIWLTTTFRMIIFNSPREGAPTSNHNQANLAPKPRSNIVRGFGGYFVNMCIVVTRASHTFNLPLPSCMGRILDVHRLNFTDRTEISFAVGPGDNGRETFWSVFALFLAEIERSGNFNSKEFASERARDPISSFLYLQLLLSMETRRFYTNLN